MRLPLTNLELILRAADPPRAVDTRELGISGLKVWSGILDEEYQTALAGSLAIETYEKMLRDPTVRTLAAIVTLPIRTATPIIEPASESATDQEAAELIQTNLLHGMTMTWDDLLRHAMLGMFWGYAICEQVFEERDGHVMWRKLPARHPRTVKRWVFDDTGGVSGVVQDGYNTQGEHVEATIPTERMLRWTWDELFDNPEGFAILRSVYKPWFKRERVATVLDIGIERFWLNLPIAKEPAGVTKEQRSDVLTLLKGFRAHEYAGAIEPFGWEIKFLEAMQRGDSDITLGYLADLRHEIMMSGLAQFTLLGTTETGARAVSDSFVDVFCAAEDTAGAWVLSVLNRYGIPRLCELNWPGIGQYPQITFPPMNTIIDPRGLIDAISNAVNAGSVIPDEDIENYVRGILHLPEVTGPRPTPDEDAPSEDPNDDNDESAPSKDPTDDDEASGASRERGRLARSGGASVTARDPNPREVQFRVDDIRSAQDRLEETLDGAMSDAITMQLDRLARALQRPVQGAVAGGKQARSRLLKALAALELPDARRYESLLLDHLVGIASEGAELAAASIGAETPDVIRSLRPELSDMASNLAAKHGADILFALRDQVPRDVDAGLTADAVLRNVRQAVRDRANISLAASLHAAADRVASALTRLQDP